MDALSTGCNLDLETAKTAEFMKNGEDECPNTRVNDDEGSKLPYQDLTSVVERTKQYATRCGAYGDIWECKLAIEGILHMVAVKAIRPTTTLEDTQVLESHSKKLRRELKVWAGLQHENIVPLLGVVTGFGILQGMVSPWFNNGSLSSYLVAQHEAAMDFPARQRLLGDIAAGLRYLHSEGVRVVHGDLHSENVLVDNDGRACLTDFGLSLAQEFMGTSYVKSSVCGALRYADPELVRQVHVENRLAHPTTPSDIYSFGSLMLHVLTGRKPYDGLRDLQILTELSLGKRPQLPADDPRISSAHELLIQRCWSHDMKMRPSINEIQV